MQGFYDAVGGAAAQASIRTSTPPGELGTTARSSVTLRHNASQYNAPLNSGSAYAAVILSTPVNNSDNDGILDAWKAGPAAGDFYAGQPGYYDVKTESWVPLPGAKHGEKDLFVQLDYMCGAVLSDGSCDPTQENLFPSPDSQRQRSAGDGPAGIRRNWNRAPSASRKRRPGNHLHVDNSGGNSASSPASRESSAGRTALNSPSCGRAIFASCAAGGDCTARFPYGQKDSYHYVLFGHSLAIPAWNTRYGTLTSITVCASGVTTITTTDRGTGINCVPKPHHDFRRAGKPDPQRGLQHDGLHRHKTMTIATPPASPTGAIPTAHCLNRSSDSLPARLQASPVTPIWAALIQPSRWPLGDGPEPGHEQARQCNRRHAVP